MKTMEEDPAGGKPSGRREPSLQWCPVCRQHVRVRTGNAESRTAQGTLAGTEAQGPHRPSSPREAPSPQPPFTPLCANCAVCMLKAAGAQALKRPQEG